MSDHSEPSRPDWQTLYEAEQAKNERLVKRMEAAADYIQECALLMVDDNKAQRKINAKRIIAQARRLREEAQK